MSDTYNDPDAFLVGGTDEKQRQFLRKKCRESLYFLCKAVLGFKDFTPAVHLKASLFIQRQDAKRKLLMLPRSFFKSYNATIGYTIWLLIQEDDGREMRGVNERILIANAAAKNAEQFLSKIKSVFERNTLFQFLFPELIPDFTSKDLKWNVEAIIIPRSVDYPEPTVSTIGVGGNIVGRHFTRIILDDLINDQHAISPELMRKAIDWYKYTESLLEVSALHELLVIGTRWAFNDLYSYIEENEGEYSSAVPLGFIKHIRHAIEDDKPIFPERFSFTELARLRAKLGDYMFSCNPADADILMHDFTTKKICDIKEGDEVIGFTKPENGRNSFLIKTKVLAIGSREAPVLRYTLKSGRIIRCTPDHKWFTGRWSTNKDKRESYLPAKLGSKLMFVCDPKIELPNYDHRYLAGIYDGEGSCYKHLSIAQKKSYNPEVWDEISRKLKDGGFDYQVYKDNEQFVFGTEFNERRRFLLQVNPIKKDKIIDSLYISRWIQQEDEVIKIDYDGIEKVYSFQTETGNYICWGYASKNCLYLNNPRQPGVNDFNRDWLRYYRFAEKGKLVLGDGTLVDPLNMDRVLIVDIATSVRKDADFSAIVVVGVDPSLRVFLLEAWHARVPTKQLLEKIFSLASRWRVRAAFYEDSATQKLIELAIQQYAKETGQYINILPVKAGTKQSKEQRIRLVQPYFEKGLVYVRETMGDFMNEYADFPLGKNDDLLDAFAYFPRCNRFDYPEPASETKNEEEDRLVDIQAQFELEMFVTGRSIVTGY